MSDFNETLARMKGLMTYGKVNEDTNQTKNYSLEHHKVAADGKTYGIIRECNKFYIKQAQPGKELVAEAYSYIGGYNNKKNYEYLSFSKALKNFGLKMASINEACDGKVNIESLNPYRANLALVEGTDKMKNQIARCRQIMHNTAVLMNEEAEIGASEINGAKMHNAKNDPEKESGHGVEFGKEVNANPEFAGKKTSKREIEGGAFTEKAQQNECCNGGGCYHDNCDWETGLGKGEDPKNIGWDIEGQQQVNEEEGQDMFNDGLPSEAGVGDANKAWVPGAKTINESEDEDQEDELGDVEGVDDDDEEGLSLELSLDGEEGGEGLELSLDGEDDDDLDLDGEDFDDETEGVDESDPDAVRAEIERLQAVLDNIEDGEDELPEDEPEDELPEYEPEDEDEDAPVDDEEEFGPESIENITGEDVFDGAELNEAKKMYMESIVNGVVKTILKEDKLNVWGKHPGYRKKPMELPATGEDKNQWGEDWNDESVHSEEPFGSKIGSSMPFGEDTVEKITNSIMEIIKKKK